MVTVKPAEIKQWRNKLAQLQEGPRRSRPGAIDNLLTTIERLKMDLHAASIRSVNATNNSGHSRTQEEEDEYRWLLHAMNMCKHLVEMTKLQVEMLGTLDQFLTTQGNRLEDAKPAEKAAKAEPRSATAKKKSPRGTAP